MLCKHHCTLNRYQQHYPQQMQHDAVGQMLVEVASALQRTTTSVTPGADFKLDTR